MVPPPTVSVRSIEAIGGDLFAVVIRTDKGVLVRMIVPLQMATAQCVAMCAQVVSTLAALNRI